MEVWKSEADKDGLNLDSGLIERQNVAHIAQIFKPSIKVVTDKFCRIGMSEHLC